MGISRVTTASGGYILSGLISNWALSHLIRKVVIMSETYQDGRFRAGYLNGIYEQDFWEENVRRRQGLTPETEARLLELSSDPAFIKGQIDQKARDISRQVLNVIDLANDDLYIAANKWAEQPEELGRKAAQLAIEARWDKEHGDPVAALSKYRRELRVFKAAGLGNSLGAGEVKKEIEVLTWPLLMLEKKQ